MECPICYECLEGVAVSTTVCGHVFHAACLDTWLERATTCPSCRGRLAAAPTDPNAEPIEMGWFEERERASMERNRVWRDNMVSMANRIQQVKAELDSLTAELAARSAKRSAAAKRGAATRAANRLALMKCN